MSRREACVDYSVWRAAGSEREACVMWACGVLREACVLRVIGARRKTCARCAI